MQDFYIGMLVGQSIAWMTVAVAHYIVRWKWRRRKMSAAFTANDVAAIKLAMARAKAGAPPGDA